MLGTAVGHVMFVFPTYQEPTPLPMPAVDDDDDNDQGDEEEGIPVCYNTVYDVYLSVLGYFFLICSVIIVLCVLYYYC